MANFGLGGFGGLATLFQGSWIKPQKEDRKESNLQRQSLQVLDADDGSQIVDTTHYYTPTSTQESAFQTSAALVNEYRAMALDMDVDTAIDDIINAAVTTDEEDQVIDIDLSKSDLSESVQEDIREEFEHILRMMAFETSAYEKFKQWYVDGRQYYQIIVDESRPSDGIQRLVPLDPRAMKRVKEVTKKLDPESRVEKIERVESYYVYNPAWASDNTFGGTQAPASNQNSQSVRVLGQTLKIDEKMIAFVHSGILSPDGILIYSHLEKARKPLNNLKMMRDAVVIYRITRAPERRVFYVDVGSLPKKSAEEYMQNVMGRHKSKLSYDPTSGKVIGQPYQQTMLEDFWLPRREGGRGTEIDTLAGGQNLGDIDDVLYFQRLLFRSLNVPIGRLEGDNGGQILLGGRGAEVTRDEWKFNKFIQRLRRRYSMLFKSILKTQLELKGIASAKDWEETIEPNLKFVYASDSYVKEQQDNEAMNAMMGALSQADPFVGKYYSKEWVQRNVAKMSDEDIAQENERMEEERKQDQTNELDHQSALAAIDAQNNPPSPPGQ